MKTQNQMSIRLTSAVILLSLTMLLPNAIANSGGVPAGVYATTVTLADIPPGFPPEAAEILVGTWTIEFTEGRTTIVTRNGEFAANGKYTSNKSHLVIQDLGGPLACTDAPGIAVGIYTWSFENNELSLAAVLDRCFGRQFVLTLRPAVRL